MTEHTEEAKAIWAVIAMLAAAQFSMALAMTVMNTAITPGQTPSA
jgi:hypothetical protein